MCLLVHQPASTRFSDEFLVDVYSANRDGLGVMFSEGGKLHVYKVLPKTSREFVDFYRAYAEGRECVWHARMMTHGDINLDNCHPYRVTDRVHLAHNGILATGNDWDTSRSDTWHFIRNIIGPAVESRESLLLDDEWLSFIGDLIGGGNKLGLMSADGVVAIINRQSGVTYSGAWLSNTYAWSAHRFGMASAPVRSYATPIWEGYGLGDYSGSRSRGDSLLKITRAARNCYARGTLAQWVQDAPSKASRLLSVIEDDPTGATGERVYKNPDWVVESIGDYFEAEVAGF